MKKEIQVYAPASVSNLNCGFDVLGFALSTPGDTVALSLNSHKNVTLEEITGDQGKLPRQPDENTASAVVMQYLEHIGSKQGVSIRLHKGMPLNSGLGSSAASSVAALVGINELMGKPLNRQELLPLAMEGERIACGNAHADNVAPSLLGGLVLIRSYDPLEVVELPFPQKLWVVVIHPNVSIPTREAREILPEMIPLKMAVRQWGNVAGLIAGFYRNDLELIGRSMEDYIVEPHRSARIPQFEAMRNIAMKEGAVSFGISGSGPTVFAFSSTMKTAAAIAKKTVRLLHDSGVFAQFYISKINPNGAQVTD
jgi:homoserine kinase